MTIHDLRVRSRWLDRVRTGQKRAEICKHDRDYQVGDVLHLIEVDDHGWLVRDWVERDARGRFVHGFVARPHVPVRITHVLDGRQTDGIRDDHCLLSIQLVNEGDR